MPLDGGAAAGERASLRERLAQGRVEILGKDGLSYVLRPIRRTDAASMIRGFQALSPRDRWLRFLHAMPELTPEAAAAFASPDPALDICLVIEGQGALAGDIVGGARITGAAGRADGEFSVSMRPEVQGMGLARQALQTALEAAAEAGYRRIHGHVSIRNDAMRRLAGRLGFTLRPDPDEPGQLIAELDLASRQAGA